MRAWLVGIMGLVGCGLLSPRSPQPPEPGGDEGYQQPITPLAVVGNLRLSISRRDAVLFLRCLVDSAVAPGRLYQFEPSGQALARYAAVFAQWSREAEWRSFVAMMSRIPSGLLPELVLIAPMVEQQTPDSAVFRAEYRLYVPHQEAEIPTLARGSLRWTLIPTREGMWAILRWSDRELSDTAAVSWSVLKALWSQ
ncbi:MAG: hypothetical protein NZ473_05700 [Candidatus Kapabacteria bacterium]|nr:hypothetical protein [Candidatus Kapabacteria bacterium]MDW8225858.1 hypothetical protein [Bacteroidota bacterium]